MTRDTRKSSKSGVYPPVKSFDEVDRRHCVASCGWGEIARMLRRKILKTYRVSCNLASSLQAISNPPFRTN